MEFRSDLIFLELGEPFSFQFFFFSVRLPLCFCSIFLSVSLYFLHFLLLPSARLFSDTNFKKQTVSATAFRRSTVGLRRFIRSSSDLCSKKEENLEDEEGEKAKAGCETVKEGRSKENDEKRRIYILPVLSYMPLDSIFVRHSKSMWVKARAPGKIILAGEHAVVHGSAAVAASIDLYTYASVAFPSAADNDDRLILELKDMGLEFSWEIGRIKEAIPERVNSVISSPRSCPSDTVRSIAALVEEQNIPEAKVGLAAGVTAFLWLYISIQGYKAGKVVVNSEIPLGAGLGSSAAFCVSLSAALLSLSDSIHLDLDLGMRTWIIPGETELELINRWAFAGEKIIHGRPSGIDNTVSTFGNMIKYRGGELTRIKSNMPLKMLITNTKIGRNTKAIVAGVSERAVSHPNAMTSVFTAVDSISNEVAVIIQSPPSDDDLSIIDKEKKLEELMEMNQGLLQCMGVSHASIETVLRTTLKYKLASKLTGAGGGGCVLTLLPTLLSAKIIDKVIAELESCGFQCLIAGIGGNGLEICFGDL